MSINKLISIKNPIIDALDAVGADHNKDMPWFTRLAELAEREIGSYYQWKRLIKVLDIVNCRAELPCGAMSVQRAMIGDFGCDCQDLFLTTCIGNPNIGGTYADVGGFLVVDGVGIEGNSEFGIVSCEVQDNKLVFMKNYDGQKVTVQYLGYETDCDGFMKINENHVRAITAFILWNYCKRSRFKPSPMSYQDMKSYEQEWNTLASHARADDNELTESQRLEISNMLNDPFAGRGLSLTMHTTIDYSPYN